MNAAEDTRISDAALRNLAKYSCFHAAEQRAFLELIELRATSAKLRAKLLQIAGECAGCGGSGSVTVPPAMRPAFGDVIPCADCEDIRAVLA